MYVCIVINNKTKNMSEEIRGYKELTEEGNYKYVGFILASGIAIDGQDKVLGLALVHFKDVETNEIFYIENHKISGSDAVNPYGVFTGSIGNWNSNFDIEINEGIYLISY